MTEKSPMDYQGGPENEGGSKWKKQLVVPVIASLLVFIGAAYALGGGPYVLKSVDEVNYKALLDKVNSAVTTVESNVTASKSKVDTAIAGIPAQVSSSMAAVTGQITAMQGTVNAAKTQADTAIARADAAATKASVADLQASAATKASVADLVKVNEAQQKQIDELKDVVKKLATPPAPTTTTTSNGASSNYAGVTATITSLYPSISGMPMLTFSVQPATGGAINSISLTAAGSGYSTGIVTLLGGSGIGAQASIVTNNGTITSAVITSQGQGYLQGNVLTVAGGLNGIVTVQGVSPVTNYTSTQNFILQVSNTNSSPMSNVQLALGLAVVDSNGNPVSSMPSWITPGTNVQVSSAGLGVSWTYSSTVAPNTMVFTTGATSSIFGLGQIDLAAGATQSYTEYITITNSSPTSANSLYLYPIIRVIGATSGAPQTTPGFPHW